MRRPDSMQITLSGNVRFVAQATQVQIQCVHIVRDPGKGWANTKESIEAIVPKGRVSKANLRTCTTSC